MAEDERPNDDETISMNIVHHFPEGVDLTFCDNIAIQHTPSEFTITFSQVRQPILASSSEYATIKTIPAEVVARIVLTPPKMAEFIASLQENWGIYQRRMKAIIEARKHAGTTETTPNPTS